MCSCLIAESDEYTMRLDNLDKRNPIVLCAKKVFKFGQIKYYVAAHPSDLDSKSTCVLAYHVSIDVVTHSDRRLAVVRGNFLASKFSVFTGEGSKGMKLLGQIWFVILLLYLHACITHGMHAGTPRTRWGQSAHAPPMLSRAALLCASLRGNRRLSSWPKVTRPSEKARIVKLMTTKKHQRTMLCLKTRPALTLCGM